MLTLTYYTNTDKLHTCDHAFARESFIGFILIALFIRAFSIHFLRSGANGSSVLWNRAQNSYPLVAGKNKKKHA